MWMLLRQALAPHGSSISLLGQLLFLRACLLLSLFVNPHNYQILFWLFISRHVYVSLIQSGVE